MRSSHLVQSSHKSSSHLLRRGGAFGLATLCGASMLVSQAWAQEAPALVAPPAVLPGVPAPAAPAVSAATLQGPALISLRFENAFVADIVRLIAEQGNVDIIINDDVSDVRIKYLNLSDKTPEEAIKQVAETANLVWRKTDRNTYIIAKVLPEAPQTETSITPVPQVPVFNPVTDKAATVLSAPNLSGFPELLPTSESDNGATREYQYIKIRNVTPRMMLYWIDPENNPEPLEYVTSRKNIEHYQQTYFGRSAIDPVEYSALQGNGGGVGGSSNYYNPYAPASAGTAGSDDAWSATDLGQFAQPYSEANAQFGGNRGRNNRNNRGRNNRNRNNRNGRGGGGGGGGVFDLPEGVESVVAVDPQNALLVYATPRGFEQLQSIINFLDQPLKQVEIEAQFIDVNTSDVSQLGIDFSSSNGPFTASSSGAAQPAADGGLQLGFVRGNFQARLSTLISNNRAKIVNAPRVTAINNLTASLQSSRFTPITLNTTTTGIGGQVANAQQVFFIQSTIGLTVTPTINNDDTITVVMQPQVSIQQGTGAIPSISQQLLQTVANVKDGDTIALGGLRTKTINHGSTRIPILSSIPILGNLFKSRNNNDSEGELIIFLTARILRRLEDGQPVPGT